MPHIRTTTTQPVLKLTTARDFLNMVINSAKFTQIACALMLSILVMHLDLTAGSSLPGSWDEDELENMPTYEKQVSNSNRQCQYPCKCPNKRPFCLAGVTITKDGCDCCFICSRQQGDICDAKNTCDQAKGLYCDYKLDGGTVGICRAKDAQPCHVDNNIYKDGEEFKLNCSMLCTCQNGLYACSTLCPQEERSPSKVHCKEPMLVQIESRCCREWVCPHSHSLPGPDTEFPTPGGISPPYECKPETTDWSPCSVTCDMGVSIRVTNENRECETVQERRLCYVRPCAQNDKYLEGKACKSTWKESKLQTLMYEECHSVLQYKLKYCSTCKKRKCCGPGRTKTQQVEFRCPDGKIFFEKFMRIKNCDCFKARRCPFD